MRTKNAIINSAVGVGGLILTTIFSFIVRTIFIYKLGAAYLGISGLYTNILSMLSIAELGIGNAIIFSLYIPIAKNNIEKIKSLMKLYEKTYKIIGVFILLAGLLILPFLRQMVKSDVEIPYLHLLFLLFLSDTVLSYFFFSYKRSIIIANQKIYIVNGISTVCTILMYVLQIIFLLKFKNFILYIVIQILMSIIQNSIISIKSDKMYPFITDKQSVPLKQEERKQIFNNIKALFIYKFAGVLLNSTDNIVLSSFVGIVWTGIYSNYFLITRTINLFLSQIFSSMIASIGNLNASDDVNKKKEIFNVLVFLSVWLYGVCAICLWVLFNDFMLIWVGKNLMLSQYTVLVIVISFYITGVQTPVWTYRDTMGLFVQGKYRPIIAAIINLISSIILVNVIGIAGIFVATILARLSITMWFDPKIVYKYGFKSSPKQYFLNYIIYVLLVTLIAVFTTFICSFIPASSYAWFILKTIICFTFANFMFFIMFRKKSEFVYLKNIVSRLNIARS